MTWSESDLAALERAIAKGVKVVKYKDSEVQYHSLEEMIRLRDLMRRELGLTRKSKRVAPSFSKGLHSCRRK